MTPRTHHLSLVEPQRTLYRSAWIVYFFLFPFLFFTKTPADHRAVQEVPPLGDSPTLSQFPFNTDLLALLRQSTSCHSTTTFWGYRFLAWMVRVTVLQFPFTISPILKEIYSARGQVFRGIIEFIFFFFLQVEIIIMFSREWNFAGFLFNKQYRSANESRKHETLDLLEYLSSSIRIQLLKIRLRLPVKPAGTVHGSVPLNNGRKSRIVGQSCIDEYNLFRRQSPFTQR